MTTTPPRIDPVQLAALELGTPDDLGPRADLESVQINGIAVSSLSLRGATFDGVRLDGLRADELDLTGARFVETIIEQTDVPVVKAARSVWRDVRVTGRWGSVEAYETEWRSVQFTGCKLSFVNLRGAELTDVSFTDCQIDELDLIGAEMRRASFPGTRIGRLDVQHGRLADVDLRQADLRGLSGIRDLAGATLTPYQLTLLSPMLADELGLKIED